MMGNCILMVLLTHGSIHLSNKLPGIVQLKQNVLKYKLNQQWWSVESSLLSTFSNEIVWHDHIEEELWCVLNNLLCNMLFSLIFLFINRPYLSFPERFDFIYNEVCMYESIYLNIFFFLSNFLWGQWCCGCRIFQCEFTF